MSDDAATQPDDDQTIASIIAEPTMHMVNDDVADVISTGGIVSQRFAIPTHSLIDSLNLKWPTHFYDK